MPNAPIEFVIWNAQECADHLKQKRHEFLRTTRHRDDFPPELPNRPRHWQAIAVMEWALRGVVPLQISPQRTQKAA